LVLLPATRYLSDAQVDLLRAYQRQGGKLLGITPVATHDENYDERTEPAMRDDFKNDSAVMFDQELAAIFPDEARRSNLMDTIRRLEGEPLIEIDQPGAVVTNLFASPDRMLRVLHVVNYSRDTVRNIRIRLNGVQVDQGGVEVLSADDVSRQITEFKRDDRGIEFVLSELYIYSLVVVHSSNDQA